ncbi:hypothetical protein LTR91_005422 [Friedmanniomyces endolithicus]|uniref:Kanamycin B dioxygenase n=1 Tax=Friedmanniomyces endolithicus TaxID=329885 RepID=A0AAN6KV73_9PEZI|nr:hypothetical protein LTR57_007184 [Friedmanniomyces endolithicus]KAK0996629.1 hypothetical protein LTS01_006422 [Friedmanniomyces endolithicus]KAK1001370.1 hypothetical protein LTR91_005422 [Friedmanniomyces endolithicus]
MGDLSSDHRLYNQVVHEIHIANKMRDHGEVSDEVIAEAIAYLHHDGILVLANAINPSHLDDLEAVLGPEAEEIAKDPQHHFNFGRQVYSQYGSGSTADHRAHVQGLLRGLLSTALALTVAKGRLGESDRGGHRACDVRLVRLPLCEYKPRPLWPFAFAFNIPLCDMSVENGSTELWIGSHKDSNIDQHCTFAGGETGLVIKPELLEERRQHSPPIQPSTKKGSLIIRDIRLWHAGMPNRTNIPRIMLAFVYQPRWFQAPSRVILPLRAKRLVEQWEAETGVEFQATWVDGVVDHKTINSEEVDFSTRSKALRELEEMMHLPAH